MRVRRGEEDRGPAVGERRPSQMHLLLFLLVLSPATALNALYKGYSGTRLRNDSLVLVYHYEQTFAVVEIGKNRELFNCELIEAYESSLQKELLKNLTAIGKTYKIRFASMLDLMNRCDELPPIRPITTPTTTTQHPITDATGSILNGVLPDLKKKMHLIRESFTNHFLEPVPLMPFYLYYVVLGTRWCGNGDIASSYYDLGTERSDRCCRKHDLCPIKVRNTSPKYGITNKGYSVWIPL
ncbi:uncharacterized protein [Halyomorpha halys]|uniref:uncharacterized protein isoform X3 n=1 Tax=Halyomorpha halys TaxID=286706 RepID=UPI000D0C8685|nr:uncharacterized protein LOC106685168 isoform X3 [Halyomorpha halys]